jgi:hypothetical protein
MNRSELYENIEIVFLGLVCLNFIMVFIIPALVCRLVQDNSIKFESE